jgi:hypothetical protein
MTPSGKVTARYARNALVAGVGFGGLIAVVPELGGPNPAAVGGGVIGCAFIVFIAQFRNYFADIKNESIGSAAWLSDEVRAHDFTAELWPDAADEAPREPRD